MYMWKDVGKHIGITLVLQYVVRLFKLHGKTTQGISFQFGVYRIKVCVS